MESHAVIVIVLALATTTGICGAEMNASDATPAIRQQVLGNSQLCELPTASNGRDYMLHVALPYDYDSAPEKRYPVLFICDGYYHFKLIRGFCSNLIYDKVIPHFFLGGVGYPGNHEDYGRTMGETPLANAVAYTLNQRHKLTA